MKKFRKITLFLALCMIFGLAAPAAHALDEPSLVAKAVVLADVKSGRILYSKNMNDKVAPASLTKIMTALITVEAIESGEISMDDIITAQSDCRIGMDEESSTAGIVPGEKLSVQDLLYCAMLVSANEACNILGTQLSGSISAFVDRMNERAQLLGCTGTHFANTNGLTADDHYTTAYDFYLISREAIKHPLFMQICTTDYYEVPATDYCDLRKLNNSNALMSDGSIYGADYLYEGTAGVKTGYTRAAGYCLVSTCLRGDVDLLAVVMGSTGVLNSDRSDYGNFVDSIALYDWAFGSFSYRTLLGAEPVTEAEVALSKDGKKVVLKPAEEVRALLPADVADDEVNISTVIYDDKLTAPIEAGTELGELEISVRGESFGRIKLVSANAIEISKGEYLKQRLHDTFSHGWFKALVIIVVIIALAYAILVIRYRRMRRRHMRERRMAEQRRRMERERMEEQARMYREPYRRGEDDRRR